LDIEGVVAGSFLSDGISAFGREWVKAGLLDWTLDLTVGVSVETLGKVSVAPHNGGLSSFGFELNWDFVIGPVDPGVEGGGDNQLNNFFVLLDWPGSEGTHGNAEDGFLASWSLTVSVCNVESEGSGGGGGSWDHTVFGSWEEIGEVSEGEDGVWQSSNSVTSLVVLLGEASGEVGWGQEDRVDGCGQQKDCEKIFDHDFIYN